MTQKSKRIQRRRVKGWRMPENTVYVGRPTKWGNPYKINETISIKNALVLYREFLNKWVDEEEIKNELRGKDLCCWCKEGEPCHADILLEIANS